MFDLYTGKLSDKISISIILISAIGLSLQGCKVDNQHGVATPDRVVEQYLLALEDRNVNMMIRLAPETPVVRKEIVDKIYKFGGHKIKDRQISYIKPKPTLWMAKIHGVFIDKSGKRKVFDDSISIEYQSKGHIKLYGGRWYLLF